MKNNAGTFAILVFGLTAGLFVHKACATEILHPILRPNTWVSVEGAAELDEDVYSADLTVSAELAFPLGEGRGSIYADGAFRFLSYSYEYAWSGYIHNYCNLHVNGFNETYVGTRLMPFGKTWGAAQNIGLNLGWRFPPGEGSQLQRHHRLNVEPFYTIAITKNLTLGGAFRYNKFLQANDFVPGDEIGIKISFLWKFLWNEESKTGWIFDEIFLFQKRIQESENLHLAKPYRKMDDAYQGFKLRFDAARTFGFAPIPISFGLNYEMHRGTLFGYETGHRIGIFAKAEL